MIKKIKDVSPATWARTICLIIALVNQCLAVFGKEAIPIADNDTYQLVTVAATIITGIVSWWKNNSFTADAIMMDDLKRAINEAGEDE